jgi:murein DD-endopeptidase MepM/ murein hydrolase activator NlpD
MFGKKLKRITLFFAFCFFTKLQANVFLPEPDDSISVKQPISSLIQNMNKEQLNLLVDFLLEMDTIPKDLIEEINCAISNLKSTNKIINKASFPAADIYAGWEINNLFPEKDMLRLKKDSSITINLKADGQDDYFHPFQGPITSYFGWRDSAQHNGIDIDLNKGDKVAAAFGGMVRIAKRFGGFGNVVIIRHYNGLETVYAHLWKIKVKAGDVVTAGQIIGLGGSTGHSTGSHLHFEIRLKGVPINPKYLVLLNEQKIVAEEITIKKTKWGLAAYPTDIKFYTVQKGDTVFEIAKRFGVSTAKIKQLNGMTSGRVRLKVGQAINIAE